MKTGERKGLSVPGLGVCVNDALQIISLAEEADGTRGADISTSSSSLPPAAVGSVISSVSGLAVRDVLHLNCILAAQVGHLVDVEFQTGDVIRMKVRPSPNPSRSDLFRLCQLAEAKKRTSAASAQTEVLKAHSHTQTKPLMNSLAGEGILLDQCRQLRDELGQTVARFEKAERRNMLLRGLEVAEVESRLGISGDFWIQYPVLRRQLLSLDQRGSPGFETGAKKGEEERRQVLLSSPNPSAVDAAAQTSAHAALDWIYSEPRHDNDAVDGSATTSTATTTTAKKKFWIRNGVRLAEVPPGVFGVESLTSARAAFDAADDTGASSDEKRRTSALQLKERCQLLEAEVARLFLLVKGVYACNGGGGGGDDESSGEATKRISSPRVAHLLSALRLGREIQPELLCGAFTPEELKSLFNAWYSGTVGSFFDAHIQPLQKRKDGESSVDLRELELWLRGRPIPRQKQLVCEEGLRLWIRRGLPFDVAVAPIAVKASSSR